MAFPAGFKCEAHVRDAGNRPRNRVGHDVIQLAHARHLVFEERPAALADVAVHAVDVGMRGIIPRGVLRMHRLVTDGAAEFRRLHPLQRPIARDEHDDDVDGGQRQDHQRHAPGVGLAKVEDWPVFQRAAFRKRLALQPHADRDEQQARDEDARQPDEHHQASVGVVEQVQEHRRCEGDEQDGGNGREGYPRHRERMAEEECTIARHGILPSKGGAQSVRSGEAGERPAIAESRRLGAPTMGPGAGATSGSGDTQQARPRRLGAAWRRSSASPASSWSCASWRPRRDRRSTP